VTIPAGETTGTIEIEVTLVAVSGLDATVEYATADDTAAAGEDYTPAAGTLTIPAGQTTGTVTVPVLDDDSDEPEERLTVSFSNPQGASLAAQSAVTVAITDNDEPPEISW
jgi:hypothetical protein